MKTAPSGWLPGVGADPQVLIKEARRRQHREDPACRPWLRVIVRR
jgi:hypothetical protein